MTLNIMQAAFSNITQTAPVDFFDFDPNGTTRFHLFDKNTGTEHSIVYETDALVAFHHINAFETTETNEVVVDLCVTKGNIFKEVFLEALESGRADVPPSCPKRYNCVVHRIRTFEMV